MTSPLTVRTRGGALVSLFLCILLGSPDALARCDIRPTPRALPASEPHELVIATQNLWRLVDTHRDSHADQPVTPERLARRIDDIASHIRETLRAPHVLALQEVENMAVLGLLSARIAEQGGPQYQAFLVDGLDPSGIDVAMLVRDPVTVESVEELFREARYNRNPLFSRPPLRVKIGEPVALELVVVHLRSGRGLRDVRRGQKVREKRRRQAVMLDEWLASRPDAGVPAVVIGDLNSAAGNDAYGEPHTILVDDRREEVWDLLPEHEQFSYVWRCKPQAIDNILISPALRERVTRGAVSRGSAGYQHKLHRGTAERLVSDHDAVAVYVSTRANENSSTCPVMTPEGELKREEKAGKEKAQNTQGPEGPC